MLNSALALWVKEGDTEKKIYKLSNVSDPAKIKPKHANSE